MEFNPTKNYYGSDLSNKKERTLFNFWEFIKTIVVFSSSFQIQQETIGIGNIQEELANEFDFNYLPNKETFISASLIKQTNLESIDKLNSFLNSQNEEFWETQNLENNQNWNQVRQLAKSVLLSFGYQNLTIQTQREEQISSGVKTISIKTILVNKNAS